MNTILSIPHLQFKHHLPFPIQQIVCLEGKGNYTLFSLSDNSRFISSRSLGLYEAAFPAHFLRLHKNCIINLDFLESLDSESHTALLKNGTLVAISRRRWPEIKELLNT